MVFVVNDEDDVDGMQDAGVAMLRAFNYITDDEDDQHAFDAIISVSPHTHTHQPLTLQKKQTRSHALTLDVSQTIPLSPLCSVCVFGRN